MKKTIVFIVSCLITTFAIAQKPEKIESKLEKIYQKQKFEKLEKKALKLKKKHPKIPQPHYYLTMVELHRFHSIFDLPNKKQWNHLRKASSYAKRINDNHKGIKDSIRQNFKVYIKSWNDNSYESPHLKKVVKTYSSHTKDTLIVYYHYYRKKPIIPVTKNHNLPITDSLRTVLIKFASELVGIPYSWAGEKPETGFDCSGFVKYVYSCIGIDLPHSAHMQSNLEGEILPLEQAKPGDLIFFGRKNGDSWSTQHAGIVYEYTENEPKVIHCVSRGVSIDGNNSSWDHYWKERILFVKRLPDLKINK